MNLFGKGLTARSSMGDHDHDHDLLSEASALTTGLSLLLRDENYSL